jgi:SAM-dependent methyltransferase
MTFDEHERLRWANRAEAYRRTIGVLCGYTAGALLDAAGVGPACRMLDAGTGPGTVARLASVRGADVVAVDAEPSMLELTRRHVPAADVRPAILPDLPFPDGAFDAAVGNFVINHLGDPAAGLAGLRRVACRGGRVAVTIWPNPQPPLQKLWGEIFEAAGAERPASLPAVPPENNFARTPDGLTRLMGAAGIDDVGCEMISWVHHADPEDWWSGPANGIGTLGLLMQDQPGDVIDRIRLAYDRLTAAYRGADGLLALPTAALLAWGTAP